MISRLKPAKLTTALSQLSYLPRTFRLIWAAAPGWTVVWGLLLLLQGLTPAILVYLTKLLVDSLVLAIKMGGNWTQARPVVIYLAVTAGLMLLSASLDSLIDWVHTAQSELIQDYIKDLVHKQSAAVDLSFYELPEFHD